MATGCNEVLVDLQDLLDKYGSLGTRTQRTFDRMRWGFEDIATIKSRLMAQVGMLTAFNSTITRYDPNAFFAPKNQIVFESSC
jgi:hypothetical protein